jgi:hypothetical protein
MPKNLRVPKFRCHKPSGQAVVTLSGKDHYLGKWKTNASKANYRGLVGEWLAGGGVLAANGDLTVAELTLAYWGFAKSYYRVEPGKSRGSIEWVRVALRALREACGSMPARSFGPLALQGIQRQLAESGRSQRCLGSTWRNGGRHATVDGSIHRCARGITGQTSESS